MILIGDSIFSRLYNIKSGKGCSRKYTESGCRINGVYKLLRDGHYWNSDAIVLSVGINNIKSGDHNAAKSLSNLLEHVRFFSQNIVFSCNGVFI